MRRTSLGIRRRSYIFFNGQRISRRDIDSNGNTIALHYYFSDHLGSHGVVENGNGTAVEQDIDYYPYGGVEYDYSAGGGVPQHYKFTGKERDSESGLDMFGARYYGSSLGRFMTPDWSSAATTVPYADFDNPQSLNLYSYTRNNPTTLRDPNGHCTKNGSVHGRLCVSFTIRTKTSNTTLTRLGESFIDARFANLRSTR